MSLVANYDSSGSESENDEENEVSVLQKDDVSNGLPEEHNEHMNNNANSNNFQEQSNENVNSLLKGLPEPKHSALANKLSDDLLEDEVKPKASQMADAPKPPAKKRQPVKIVLPTLDSDSDEEKEPKSKKAKLTPGSGKSGLTAILPPPIHAASKESNRTLLPYVFSKKKTQDNKPSSKTANKSSGAPKNNLTTVGPMKLHGLGNYGSESDDDEDADNSSTNFFSIDSKQSSSSNFFSLNSNNSETTEILPLQPSNSLPSPPTVNVHTPRVSLNLPAPVKQPEKEEENKLNQSDTVKQTGVNETFVTKDAIQLDSKTKGDNLTFESLENSDVPLNFNPATQDAPLSFKSSMTHAYRNVLGTSSGYHGAPSYSAETVGPSVYDQDESVEGYTDAEGIGALQQDAEFLKLQGKNQRGKEPINIVDVNADDFINPAEYQKALSEEIEYRPSSKKGDGPTSQQKRKHQITYLAFQAKEKELELKNSWSQNRMTKKQTQAKYGF